MQVKLKRDWFAPDGSRKRARDNPHQFPQGWKDRLPPNAEVIAEAPTPKPSAKKAAEDG